MNLVELDRALRQLRLSGIAAVLDTRLRQAQAEKMAPIDLVSALVADERRRRRDRLSISNSLSGGDRELHEIPAVGDPTHPVQMRGSARASTGERQRRVAVQGGMAACGVVVALKLASSRSLDVRFGTRLRARRRTMSCCLSRRFSAITARTPPPPQSFTVTTAR